MSKKNSIDKAYDILKTYKGENNRILYLQRMYSLGQCILGDFDVEYILNNHDFEPYMVPVAVNGTSTKKSVSNSLNTCQYAIDKEFLYNLYHSKYED